MAKDRPKMNKLNRAQKDKVRRFAAVADADEEVALKILKDARWDLEVGLEMFFTAPLANSGSTSPEAVEATYAKYRADDDDEEMVGAEGIERFCEDIGIDAMDPVILVVSLKMGAQAMGKYTKEEFTSGLRRMGADTAAKIKAKIPELRKELENDVGFKDVYEFSFGFAKDLNQKSLPLETACGMWKVLLTGKWDLVDEWCEFLEKEHGKQITHDTWSQALEFSRQIGVDMQGYDPAGAWPYLIDEFVEHMMAAKENSNEGGGD